MKTAFLLLAVWFVTCAQGTELDGVTLPACLDGEAAIKTWVETTIHDLPPVGGTVQMLKHREPKYAENDKVGQIWIVTSLVKVTIEKDGKDLSDTELVFMVYHCDTKESEIKLAFAIPPEQVQKFLNAIETKPEKPEKKHSASSEGALRA